MKKRLVFAAYIGEALDFVLGVDAEDLDNVEPPLIIRRISQEEQFEHVYKLEDIFQLQSTRIARYVEIN